MEEKKRKFMVEIDRSLGRRLDTYIEMWNSKNRGQYIEKSTRDSLIQSFLRDKLENLIELIIDDGDEKRAYYAQIERKEKFAFGTVLHSENMIKFKAQNTVRDIESTFEEVILRYERFVKARGRSYVIID